MKKTRLILLSLLLLPLPMSAILPDRVYVRLPQELGLMYKELDVKTSDGFHIKTWFFPAQDALSEQEIVSLQGAKRTYQTVDSKRRPTLIICNGDAGNMSYFQLYLALRFTNEGFNVVTFDWRGFGQSAPFEMDRNYLCYTEMLKDYEAVIEAVDRQPEVHKKGMVVMGWSTGAYLSMITAHRNPKVDAFIGRSLPTNFEDLIPLVMQVRHKTRDQLIIPSDFPVGEMPVCIAPKFKKPIFLINGAKDLRTPVWMSEKVLSLLPKETPRELMVVENAAHGGTEDPIMVAFDQFLERVLLFLNKNLPINY